MKKEFFIFSFIILLAACSNDTPVPKPVGYYRIDLPTPEYKAKDPEGCPFRFEISYLSRLEVFENGEHPCWFNIAYPSLHARMHMTYKPVDGNLREFLEEARTLAFEHEVKANRISTKVIKNDSTHVYGLIYDLGGNVASPYQFYLTDSIHNFIRGSLYFMAHPNPDSLQPSLDYVKRDMEHFIQSFRWE